MKPLVTPTAFTVHPEGVTLFHERNFTVRLEDEASGPFVVITSHDDGGTLRVDFDEWPVLTQAVEALRESAEQFESEP